MIVFIERWGIFGLFVAAAILIPIWRVSRARAMLNRWAQENHVQIVRREWRWVRLGPFAIAFFGHQAVYHLVVQDQSGAIRTCWAKLGGFFRGLMVDDVEIAWDNDQFAVPDEARS